MKLLILSDIHANVSALEAVLYDVKKYAIDKTILLGDHIDYGMRPNEIISMLQKFPYPIDVNIWGNHEKAVSDKDLDRFSSERGKRFSAYTRNNLNDQSKKYINDIMDSAGRTERVYNTKKYLFIHGSLEDTFWKSIIPDTDTNPYCEYDYVFSGHSHLPHVFSRLYKTDAEKKKKTMFINPGSVGQPRNCNPNACYAIMNTDDECIHLNNVKYDVLTEQSLYNDEVDEFYKTRLEKGI